MRTFYNINIILTLYLILLTYDYFQYTFASEKPIRL